jgi:hypothetical protein
MPTVTTTQPAGALCHSHSRLVSVEELADIPAGVPMGARHRPVPHIDVVQTVRDGFTARGYTVAREQFAVSPDGARLFGTLDLLPSRAAPLIVGLEGGMAVGLRHANDQAFALGMIAGMRVLVCDNLAFAGGDQLLHRKHTTRLALQAEVDHALERTFSSYARFSRLVDGLRNTELDDSEAKLALYDLALDGRVIAPSQLGKVHSWYFSPEQIASPEDLARGLTDVQPRTAWALANAVTRVAREWSPGRQQDCGVALSTYLARHFRLHHATAPEAN